MGSKLSPPDEELYRRVNEVLHYMWDPIGVSGAPEARDEYDSYLPQIFGLLKANADAERIAGFLTEIATARMGLVENRAHDLKVAELLIRWQRIINERSA
jgi:hypothetical protein